MATTRKFITEMTMEFEFPSDQWMIMDLIQSATFKGSVKITSEDKERTEVVINGS